MNLLPDGEKQISLAKAATLFDVHRATVFRWVERGTKDRAGNVVRLEAVRVGGRVRTSEAALRRFFAALTVDPDTAAPSPPPATPAQQKREAKAATRELDRIIPR